MSIQESPSCPACEGKAPQLRGAELASYLATLTDGWCVVDEHHLEKSYAFPDFREALTFTNRVGDLAESQGHHPEVCVAWGAVTVRIWTYRLDALTDADFALAAAIDGLPPRA